MKAIANGDGTYEIFNVRKEARKGVGMVTLETKIGTKVAYMAEHGIVHQGRNVFRPLGVAEEKIA
jgi:hypothetical protein